MSARRPLCGVSEPAQYNRELAPHADKLLAHVQRNLDAGEIDSHFSDENVRDANSIDLIQRITFQPAPSHRSDKVLLFEGVDEFYAHIAYLDNVGDLKIFLVAAFNAPHRTTSLRISSA
jgi:hypothetical protein